MLSERNDFPAGLLGGAEQLVTNAGPDDADAVGVLLVEVGEEPAVLDLKQIHLKHVRPDADGLRGPRSFLAAGDNRASQAHLGIHRPQQ